MQIHSAEQITQRIAEAHRLHADGVVAFDGDGTLWSGDVGEDLFHALIGHKDFRPAAREQMAHDLREFALHDDGDGTRLAERVYAEYLAGRFPEERICELMTWCCAEWTRAEVDDFAHRLLGSGDALRGRLHREAIHVLEWAKKEKLDIFLVSASPRPIVEAAAKIVGIDARHVAAATAIYEKDREQADRMIAKVHRPIPYGPGKVRALREIIGERALYAAFGDNAFDVALLNEAFIPVAVRPKPRLRDRAGEVKMLVEIARES
jgi:phosphatidylglycerophosphatase C